MSDLHALDFRLSWGECDPAGIVYFASWFPWLERVQTEWLFLAGERPDTLAERRGIGMVVRHVGCDYLVPAKVFDPLRCRLTGGRFKNTSVVQSFTIDNRDTGVTHARAAMTVVFLDATGRPAPPPATLRALWGPVETPVTAPPRAAPPN
ncbi:MAG TPA: thioesterase family protein [Acidimicrobiales bacterium]|jgi:acyl-CoA thioester hydrolase|nr:thioesterase family protein [Acidimicrobiales bacterium]